MCVRPSKYNPELVVEHKQVDVIYGQFLATLDSAKYITHHIALIRGELWSNKSLHRIFFARICKHVPTTHSQNLSVSHE